MSTDLIIFIAGAIFSAISWLLKQKDAQQQESIRVLFAKHDEDAKQLQELRIQIAEGHYKKVELDVKFDRLEETFTRGFDNIGNKFDRLSEALIQHMSEEDRK